MQTTNTETKIQEQNNVLRNTFEQVSVHEIIRNYKFETKILFVSLGMIILLTSLMLHQFSFEGSKPFIILGFIFGSAISLVITYNYKIVKFRSEKLIQHGFEILPAESIFTGLIAAFIITGLLLGLLYYFIPEMFTFAGAFAVIIFNAIDETSNGFWQNYFLKKYTKDA